MLTFQALGALEITDNGEPLHIGGARQRRLVAMLLIHRNAVVSVDRLADAVFAGEPTPAASTTMRSYIARLRRLVARAGSMVSVVTRPPGYELQVGDQAFDVGRFERMVRDAGGLPGPHDPLGGCAVLREALALWHGEAYAEFAGEDWARPEAERLEELRLIALERLFDAELACGRAAVALPDIEAQVARHPLRERFRSELVLALYRSGRHADALAVVADYRHVLADELGLDPSPALARLEHRVLTHDPALASAATQARLRGYRVGDRLGSGRDGTVHAASLPGLDRELAIKTFRREIANSPRFIRSFETTAQVVASLHHPAIVPIHDYWREPDAAYLVMRRMTGGTLADRLLGGPLSAAAAAALLGRVGSALAVAAERGLVHGRLCADSVIFDAAGDAYLTDFDLGRGVDRDQAPDGLLDDVHDLAVLVRRLAPPDGELADRVARIAAVGAPMSNVVSALVAALNGGPSGTVGGRPNPYKGLRAFDEVDAADFFGRTDLVDAMVARLARRDSTGRLVLVVGGSGTGKSSVVRAGLLPRLRRGGEVAGSQAWFVATMLPGATPFRKLAESLRHVAVTDSTGLADELADADGGIDRVLRRVLPAGGELLLVVDQLEELFTMAPERDQRGFLDGIIAAVGATDSRLRVVATLRADFYDRPLGVQRFGAAVNDATVTVPAMGPADLESAVVAPAERVGGGVERALVAELVNSVIDQPAALPSLQFTLYELAERSPDTRLTLSAYRELGGVGQAIAARAESLYRSLPGDERGAVRRMFERLVVVGAEGGPARRRTPRSELSGPGRGAVLNAVIDRWTHARLLTLDRDPQTREPTVEVAHEALLRAWPRLAEWIDEDRDAIVTLARLREAAAGWDELGRDPDALYRGARLEVALGVTDRDAEGLSALERDFLDAGRERRDREAREATERAERQARDNRRLRVQVVAVAVALVVAVVGGLVAVDQSREAQAERAAAAARGLAAAADANLVDDPERSILLALAAVEQSRATAGTVLPEAEAALHRAVTASRVLQSMPGVGGQLDWSPDGALFVTEGPENSGIIDIRDAASGASVRSFRGHDGDLNQVAFSADGSKLLSAGDDGAVRVWDLVTGSRLLDLDRGSDLARFAAFSPDGSLVAVAWPDSVLQLFAVGTGQMIAEFAAPEGPVAFSPDGGRIAIGPAFDGPVLTVFDLRSRAEVYTRAATAINVERPDVGWSPDGRWIATAGGDNVVRIWDAAAGDQRFSVNGHTAPVGGLDWSPDSKRLATAAEDGTARVWEILDVGVRPLFTFSAHDTRGGLHGVAFSPDGLRVMTGDVAMRAVKIWDASDTGGAEWVNVPGVPHEFFDRAAVDFVPGRGRLAVGQDDGSVTVTDVATGVRVATVGPVPGAAEGEVGWLDVSADGELIAAANWAGPVNVWDTDTGSRRFALGPELPGDPWFTGIDWSADGDLLAIVVGGDRHEVMIGDRDGNEVSTLVAEPETYVSDVGFGPDGLLVTATQELSSLDPQRRNVTIWDVDRGAPVLVLDAVAAGRVAFDPTGRRVASTSLVAGMAEIWDPATGALLATLSAPAPANAVAFSSDGSSVATGHTDGTVRLWDPATGAQRLVLGGDGGRVGHVVFAPDGDTLASADDVGLVRVWALDLDDLMEIAASRLTRSLTVEECQQYPNIASCTTG